MLNTDKSFAGSIPQIYETYLVPLIFEPYAIDMVERLKNHSHSRVLELAAGTGVVTRLLTSELPADVSILATDLNQAMIDQAISIETRPNVRWHQADAMDLSFINETFDAVLCQFGVMFFPDKVKAFGEVYRVLKDDGVFIFNVWDSIETNEFADIVEQSLEHIFPEHPPSFLSRTPHGHHDTLAIKRALEQAGFKKEIQIETVTKWSEAQTARDVAFAYCQGTPLRNEIETHGTDKFSVAVDTATKAIERKFGKGPVKAKIQAIVITAKK